jgi:four helix bundle protein
MSIEFTSQPRYKDNPILKMSFLFAVDIVKFSELLDEKRKYILAKQILRSGTSIGANVKESQNAESRADFKHKLKIALKEADELEYWLYICNACEGYPNADALLVKLQEINKVLTKIVAATNERSNAKKHA